MCSYVGNLKNTIDSNDEHLGLACGLSFERLVSKPWVDC